MGGNVTYSVEWNRRNPEKRRATTAKWAKNNKAKIRAAEHRRKGLPVPTRPMPQFCECCGRAEPDGKALSNDHDHINGKFRGWLCGNCNRALGLLGDTVHAVRQLLAYIETSELL